MKKFHPVCIAIILLLYAAAELTVLSSAASENNSGGYDFVFPFSDDSWLSDSRHSGYKCMQCHNSLLEREKSLDMVGNCRCHKIESNRWNTRIDMKKIENIHSIKPCIRCHIGKVDEIGKNEIHEIHLARSCEICHIESQNFLKPNTTDCKTCHPYGPHGTHTDLGELCVYCHGKYGWDYTAISNTTSGIPQELLSEGNPIKHEEKTFPTIGNVIKLMLNSILKMLW